MTDESDRIAQRLWSRARGDEQAVQLVSDDALAAEIREQVRRLAHADGIRVRTARIGRDVVVVRLDARVWREDAATMRRKLSSRPTAG